MTLRAALLGLMVVVAVVFGAPYAIWMARSSEITWSYFPSSVGFCFVAIVLANSLVRRLRSSWALEPLELAIIVVMGLSATGIPVFIVGTLLAIISSPYYGATNENDWEGNIHPFLPDWLVPRPDGDAMRHFYEGLPAGQDLPFDVWLGPLAWWLSLILTVYFVCFCMVVIFRRQWVEHERLTFPLMEMPRLLIDNEGKPLFKSRLFWAGCALPFGLILFNIIGFFHIGFPPDKFPSRTRRVPRARFSLAIADALFSRSRLYVSGQQQRFPEHICILFSRRRTGRYHEPHRLRRDSPRHFCLGNAVALLAGLGRFCGDGVH